MNEFNSRFLAFILFVSFFAIAEWLWPRRKRIYTRFRRWSANFGIFAVDLLVTTGFQSIAGVAVAFYAQSNNLGLLNYFNAPPFLAFIATLVLLDLSIYLQHVVFHKVPFLWKMHKVHHADPELDVTSALRFHPLEIGLSVFFKAFVVLLLGADPSATVTFAVLLNCMAMFNHSNWKIPLWLDGILRWAIVTPDFHRIHHSTWHKETDSNYGFNLSLWDRIFKTYRAQPRDGHDKMSIGLNDCNPDQSTQLWHILLLPFKAMKTLKQNKANNVNSDTPSKSE